jgi:membrane-bound inhibitor of C-type lysozyme
MIVILGVWLWQNNKASKGNLQVPALIADIKYFCNDGKSMEVKYYQGTSTPEVVPGQPPTPTGSVDLSLSDGRQMTLPQTISGSGIRYANGDESFVFFSKGNGALVLENNLQTYFGCIAIANDLGGLPQTYENGSSGFSVRYPSGYILNTNYFYQELGPGKDIGGVSFKIATSLANGTNLGSDSYVSVEEISQTTNCTASLFLDKGNVDLPDKTITENGTTYSFASSTGAGAGNRYEERVFAIPGTNPCIAVRYFIHYGVFENYPLGTIERFNEQSLLDQFDSIRQTLIIQQ